MTLRKRRLAELRPYVERARDITGWTLDVELTSLGPGPPWSYMDQAKVLLASTRTVLDMGTVGGERFSELLEGYDGLAIAT